MRITQHKTAHPEKASPPKEPKAETEPEAEGETPETVEQPAPRQQLIISGVPARVSLILCNLAFTFLIKVECSNTFLFRVMKTFQVLPLKLSTKNRYQFMNIDQLLISQT